MFKRLATHAAHIFAAYTVAVLVASFVAYFLYAAVSVIEGNGTVWHFVKMILHIFPILVAMTMGYAFPGWLIASIVAEVWSLQTWIWFALSGAATALLALALSNGMQTDSGSVSVVIGGFAGGLAYWALAGKTSGNWKRPPEVKP